MLAASLLSRSLRYIKDNSLSVPRVKTNTGARALVLAGNSHHLGVSEFGKHNNREKLWSSLMPLTTY